mmetsp:Transcript_11698/g.30490  ORF Transcript_11698/g.30490 Transcript_11698/m.30490 type:complete len:239 (-) Transcript_11698:480-1196(-)
MSRRWRWWTTGACACRSEACAAGSFRRSLRAASTCPSASSSAPPRTHLRSLASRPRCALALWPSCGRGSRSSARSERARSRRCACSRDSVASASPCSVSSPPRRARPRCLRRIDSARSVRLPPAPPLCSCCSRSLARRREAASSRLTQTRGASAVRGRRALAARSARASASSMRSASALTSCAQMTMSESQRRSWAVLGSTRARQAMPPPPSRRLSGQSTSSSSAGASCATCASLRPR